MGQRSQIYISYDKGDSKELIARYFQWNFGDSMVSRAATLIEHISDMIEQDDLTNVRSKNKLIKLCDIDFDRRETTDSTDIIEESIKYNITAFENDNNDGKLFISVVDIGGVHEGLFGYDVPNREIHYCFTDSENKMVMEAEQYMNWDYRSDNWESALDEDDVSDGVIEFTKKNIAYIGENAQLMNESELAKFINYPYPCLDKGDKDKPKGKTTVQAERE